ncbi:MAG: hypothetical protein MI920_34820 [Kiloniellales bacterium]|nr:hypothetical protein [Kiloniellales bacterium]
MAGAADGSSPTGEAKADKEREIAKPEEIEGLGLGQSYAAQRLRSLRELTKSQQVAAVSIIRRIHRTACESAPAQDWETTSNQRDESREERFFERPMNILVIDGDRGSGKTTLLLTVHRALSVLHLDNSAVSAPANPNQKMFEELRDELALKPPADSRLGAKPVALCVPLIFPDLMEESETSMENVCAGIDNKLEEEKDRTQSKDQKRVLEGLQDELRQDVSVAWTFARRIGEQAVLENALNYEDFVRERAINNKRAYNRINIWRDFVDRLLNATGHCLLVLFFDDTDLDPRANDDILKTVRLYCDHPRVVAILSADMATLTAHLVDRRLAKLQTETEALTRITSAYSQLADTVDSFYSRHSRQAKELVRKVLPTNLRFRLTIETREDLDLFFVGDLGDREAHPDLVFEGAMDRVFKGEALRSWRAAFLAREGSELTENGQAEGVVSQADAGQEDTTPLNAAEANGDAGRLDARERIEDRRAWERRGFAFWLLNAPHKWVVGYRTRPLVAFREALVARQVDDTALYLLRLSDQSQVTQQTKGSLALLEESIRLGHIVRKWNERQRSTQYSLVLEPDVRSFDTAFVDFWIDLRITDDRCELDVGHIALNYLPVEPLRRSFEGRKMGDLLPYDLRASLGVAGVVPFAPLPRNCLYIHQFRHIVDDMAMAIADMETCFAGDPIWQDFGHAVTARLSPPDLRETLKQFLARIQQEARDQSNDKVIQKIAELSREQSAPSPPLWLIRIATVAKLLQVEELPPDYFAPSVETPEIGTGRQSVLDDVVALSNQDLSLKRFLSEALLPAEQRRQICICQWALALYLLELGGEFHVRPVRSAHHPDNIPFGPVSGKDRLQNLCERSVAALQYRSGRNALLFAWALVPVIDHLIDFGVDYGEGDSQRLGQWRSLYNALRPLKGGRQTHDTPNMREFREMIGLVRRQAGPGADSKNEKAWKRRMLSFPDLTDRRLKDIFEEVSGVLTRMQRKLRSRATVERSGEDESRSSRIEQIATLLGTPYGWTKQNVDEYLKRAAEG